MPDELITVSEAARRIGVSRKIVQTLVDHGQLPTVPVGTRVRIPARAIEAYIELCNKAAALARQAVAATGPPAPP